MKANGQINIIIQDTNQECGQVVQVVEGKVTVSQKRPA